MIHITDLYGFMYSCINKKFSSFFVISDFIISYFVSNFRISQLFQYFLSKATCCANMCILTASLNESKTNSSCHWLLKLYFYTESYVEKAPHILLTPLAISYPLLINSVPKPFPRAARPTLSSIARYIMFALSKSLNMY